MSLTVVQGIAQGVCVFAQTHEKLEGTLVMSVLVLIFAVWKKKHKTTTTRQQENLDHTENQKLKDDMTKLTKELEKKKEECKNMVGTLMLHKKELKEEKDKFKLQLMKMEEVVEISEMDLHSMEQDKGSSSAPSLDLKKKSLNANGACMRQ